MGYDGIRPGQETDKKTDPGSPEESLFMVGFHSSFRGNRPLSSSNFRRSTLRFRGDHDLGYPEHAHGQDDGLDSVRKADRPESKISRLPSWNLNLSLARQRAEQGGEDTAENGFYPINPTTIVMPKTMSAKKFRRPEFQRHARDGRTYEDESQHREDAPDKRGLSRRPPRRHRPGLAAPSGNRPSR